MRSLKHYLILTIVLVSNVFADAQKPWMVIPTYKTNISKIVFNKSGSQVYFSSSSTIYSLIIGARKMSTEFDHVWNVHDFSISNDDNFIYSTDGKIQVWARDGETKIRSDFSKSNISRQIEISPNNQYFVYCSWYTLSKVLLPDYVTQDLSVRTEKITKIRYNSSGSLLAVGYINTCIK